MKRKMLKSICAVVLSMALAVTGLNTNGICKVAAGNRETVQEETKITAEQKEKAQKEDEKVREELRQKVIADKDAEGNYAYVNTAGDAKNYFPENLDEDSGVVMVKKSHAISFAPVRKEETVQESSEKTEMKNRYRNL